MILCSYQTIMEKSGGFRSVEQRMFNKKNILIFFFSLFIIIFVFSISSTVSADPLDTVVSVDPSDQLVLPEKDFNFGVYCVPGQPIKAFELKLFFNASLISVNSVTEGDFFDGYPTFFSSGVIDNSAGSLINVYSLIVGDGNVTDPGTLVTISCTSKSILGDSFLDLLDVGIANETNFVPISVSDGNVQIINSFVFSSESPSDNTVNVPIDTSSLSISIENVFGNPFYWEISTSPDVGESSAANDTNGTKSCSVSGLSYSTAYTWYVNCKDLVNDEWSNQSYSFTTEEEPGSPPGGGGGFIINNGEPPVEENNPPEKPIRPSGPIFIEKGSLYEYSTSSYDTDEDELRFRFSWGDGTFSDWTDFISSNTTVSMQHFWTAVSDFSVTVIAQDKDGLNSSWSEPLDVVVSQANDSSNDTIVEINIDQSSSLVTNQSISFDGSNCFHPTGAIISYIWDFGDGVMADGISVSHVYDKPGEYVVTLNVMDDQGNFYSETMTVNIGSKVDNNDMVKTSNEGDSDNVSYVLVIVGFVIVFIAVTFVIFRDKIELKSIDKRMERLDNLINKPKDRFR